MESNKKLRLLIELAETPEEIEKLIEEYVGYKSYEQKLAFLKGMFDWQILCDFSDDDKDKFLVVATSIANAKYHY